MPVSLLFTVTCREGESVDLLLHAELGLPESGEASLTNLFGSRSSRLQVEHARPYLALSTIRMNPPKSMYSETQMLGAGKQDAIWKMFQHARRCRCEHAMAPGKARMLCSLIRTGRCMNISSEPRWNTL